MNQELIKKHLHPSRLYRKQLYKLTTPLFEHSLVKYFSYNRFYRNQKWIGFYTNTEPVEISLMEDRGPIFLDNNGICIESGIYFHGDLKEIIKTIVSGDIVEKFFDQKNNPGGEQIVQNGLLIVRKGEMYDESFYFSMLDSGFSASRAYYHQYIEILKQFCLYFLHKGKSLIEIAEKYKIPFAVPPSGKELFATMFFKHPHKHQDKTWFDTKKFCISSIWGDIFLSTQELNCLRLIAQGYSYAEIANHLGLQGKTVESYVQNLKNKLNVSSRAVLAQYYRKFSVLDCEFPKRNIT